MDSDLQADVGWLEQFSDSFISTVSGGVDTFTAEQRLLYDNTHGWGNLASPLFKPAEGAGAFIGNSIGLVFEYLLSPSG